MSGAPGSRPTQDTTPAEVIAAHIEAVAQAMWIADYQPLPLGDLAWSETREGTKQFYRRMAAAAVEALDAVDGLSLYPQDNTP